MPRGQPTGHKTNLNEAKTWTWLVIEICFLAGGKLFGRIGKFNVRQGNNTGKEGCTQEKWDYWHREVSFLGWLSGNVGLKVPWMLVEILALCSMPENPGLAGCLHASVCCFLRERHFVLDCICRGILSLLWSDSPVFEELPKGVYWQENSSLPRK